MSSVNLFPTELMKSVTSSILPRDDPRAVQGRAGLLDWGQADLAEERLSGL